MNRRIAGHVAFAAALDAPSLAHMATAPESLSPALARVTLGLVVGVTTV
jgi:hypothetical protein